MSSNIPISPAEAMFGPSGPISGGPGIDPRAQALIDGGKAKSLLTSDQPPSGSTPPPPKEARNGPPTVESFNAQTFALPDDVDRAALQGDANFQEFTTLAKEQGFNNSQAEKMVALHAKAQGVVPAIL
jgi:hypothetical protein